ncbi:hypothetical protein C0J50_21087 [Silurus asotus]|uniref:Alkylated DNA repair protein AlkB homologue 8 N-terminal domain-containing protein n=1 Tax=Silurus asotus TaxID=30991 RepID=A0AAD5AMV0_SILAS|nr:hypothetical protein C0J50_21087 [Silurus asotus]
MSQRIWENRATKDWKNFQGLFTFDPGQSRRAQSSYSSLIIDGSSVEIVKNTKCLSVHLVENFTRSLNTSSITKKAQQCFYFLRRLRKAHLSRHPNFILQRDHQEHPEQLHHCLFWKLHHLGSQDPAEDSKDS